MPIIAEDLNYLVPFDREIHEEFIEEKLVKRETPS